MAIELAIAVRLVVEIGVGVSAGVEDTVPKVRPVRVGETELPSAVFEPRAEYEPTPVNIPPEEWEGAVMVTTSSINLDVRKQTSHCVSIVSILISWSRVDLPLPS